MQIKRYRAYVYLLRSRVSPSAAAANGSGAGHQLPVFHPDSAGSAAAADDVSGSNSSNNSGRGNGRLVPPPIPDRVVMRTTVPGDRYSYQEAVTHHALV